MSFILYYYNGPCYRSILSIFFRKPFHMHKCMIIMIGLAVISVTLSWHITLSRSSQLLSISVISDWRFYEAGRNSIWFVCCKVNYTQCGLTSPKLSSQIWPFDVRSTIHESEQIIIIRSTLNSFHTFPEDTTHHQHYCKERQLKCNT